MNPVQLLVNQHVYAKIRDHLRVPRTSSMSSNITGSLVERPSRPTLRSATASASLRSLSQPSRDASDAREPQPSPRLATPTARIGEPLRGPVRARTPDTSTTPATPTLGRDAPDTVQHLQRQLDDTRAQLSQLALAHQLAECTARTAAVPAAADAQIQELRNELELANATRRAPTPTQPAADHPADVLALNLALHNLSAWVANPDLVKTVALGVIITVKNVSDMCAALFKLLGNLRGAQLYEKYLSHVLQLPRPGAEDTDLTFAHSAVCANLDAAFSISDRPLSPDTESVASTSASNGSNERLIRENALKVDAILSGDTQSRDDIPCPSVDQFRIADGLLLQAARHAIKADPGSAVWDSASEARTFVGAILSLLKCAGHNADQTRERHKKGAFGPLACPRYPVLYAAHGGASAITFEQIAQVMIHDYKKRSDFMGKLDFNYLTAELVIAGIPMTSGGSRKNFEHEGDDSGCHEACCR